MSDSRLKVRLILRAGRSICASPAYSARHGKPVRPEELSSHNCLVLSRMGDPQSSWRFRDGSNDLAVQVSGDRMANDGGFLRKWAIMGAGIILKSDYDVAADLDVGRLETALEPFRLADINLYAVHAAERPPRRVLSFIDYLATML